MTEDGNSGKPLTRREMRAVQRRQAAGEDPIVASSNTASTSNASAEPAQVFVQPEQPREVRYTPGSAPRETLYYGDVPKFVASSQPVETDSHEVDESSVDLGADLPKFEVPRSSFLDSLLNGTFRAESLLNDSELTESLIKETLGEEEFEPVVVPEPEVKLEPEVSPTAVVEPAVEPEPEAPSFEPVPTPASKVQEPPVQSQPASTSVAEPVSEPETRKRSRTDADEGLFSIPTSLTGDVATASIVIENATNPLDIIANPATASIPLRTGSIDIQLPESRTKVQAPKTDPIRAQVSADTGNISQIITPLKSQTIALTGELGHARGVNFKPIDTQKYWVLGTGLLMVVVGVATLVSFLMGYLH